MDLLFVEIDAKSFSEFRNFKELRGEVFYSRAMEICFGVEDTEHRVNLFKGAAAVASSKPSPFQEFYTALVAKGMRPEIARLTLARKIVTIVLMVWKRGVCFDANHLKPQTA